MAYYTASIYAVFNWDPYYKQLLLGSHQPLPLKKKQDTQDRKRQDTHDVLRYPAHLAACDLAYLVNGFLARSAGAWT